MSNLRRRIVGSVVLGVFVFAGSIVVVDRFPGWNENRRLDRIASALNDSPQFCDHFTDVVSVLRLSSGVQGAAVFQSGDYKDSEFEITTASGGKIVVTVKWILNRVTGEIVVTGFYEEGTFVVNSLAIRIPANGEGGKASPATS